MKIYTRIVCAWQPDGTLKRIEEDSFEYEGFVALCKDSPEPPKPPDYAAAAKETNTSSRVNQYTPYGSQVWTPGRDATPGHMNYDPLTGMETGWTEGVSSTPWSSQITLNPDAQRALDAQMGLSSQMGEFAQKLAPGVMDQYSRPMDLSSVDDIADRAYKAQTDRLDPQWKQNEEMQKNSLANQGLSPGGEAYDNANRIFEQSKNDAYQQARLGAIGTMPQTYQLASSAYNQPLNTLNSLRSGSQIQNPQFGQTGPGANMLGAAQSQGQYAQGLYGAQVGETNAANANTTTGVAAAATIAAMMF